MPIPNREKDEIVQNIGENKKITIQRSKGLGENDPDMMWMTTMNPATRRLIKVMPQEAEATAAMFDLLWKAIICRGARIISQKTASKFLETCRYFSDGKEGATHGKKEKR